MPPGAEALALTAADYLGARRGRALQSHSDAAATGWSSLEIVLPTRKADAPTGLMRSALLPKWISSAPVDSG